MSEEAPRTPAAIAQKKGGGLLPFLIDFGPLLIFFLVFKYTQQGDGALAATRAAINGTIAFMVAILVAVAVSRWKLGKVSPMLWLSAVLVVGFGALTVYFNDERFIQIKPTIIYGGFAIMLIGGWFTGKPLMRYLLENAFEGVDFTGWMKLSRNWGIFFTVAAIANTIFANQAWFTFEQWLSIKLWGFTIVSMLFAMSQIPMLMTHGLDLEGKAPEAD